VSGDSVTYTEEESAEAWLWVNAHGPANAWTATAGTAARMIGRLLQERQRLLAVIANRDNRLGPYWQEPHD
jgi:hypothetical protein